MCGRYAASAADELLEDTFDIDEVVGPPLLASYNVAPTDPVRAVVERELAPGELTRRLVTLRWGLVPSWSKDASGAARLINARVETVASKPAFRKAFATRRCLLPADGYYEWYPLPAAGGGKPVKQPYFIRPAGGGVFAMAGLYEFWKTPDGDWLPTCTVITTTAADSVGHLHDRMPMTLTPATWDAWLDPHYGGDPLDLLHVPGPELEASAVSAAVNRVANNSPDLVVPLPGDPGRE
ncbi:MAG TPA: SOS response-associated peptidase [Propionicimonas sp.]|nr:SOS response-associated peptidase [Propionicimonas sp.]